jgi:hypothetical protein
VKRVRKWDVIAPKEGVSRSMAEQILSDHLGKINWETRDAAIVARWLHTVGVKLCDSCQRRLLAALSPGD